MEENRREPTIEERVKVVIVNFAELQEVLTEFWTCFHFEVDDDVPKGSFEQYGHECQLADKNMKGELGFATAPVQFGLDCLRGT